MKKLAIFSLSLALAAGAQAQTAEFDYFKYAGNDARFNVAIDKSHQYYNPVLAAPTMRDSVPSASSSLT